MLLSGDPFSSKWSAANVTRRLTRGCPPPQVTSHPAGSGHCMTWGLFDNSGLYLDLLKVNLYFWAQHIQKDENLGHAWECDTKIWNSGLLPSFLRSETGKWVHFQEKLIRDSCPFLQGDGGSGIFFNIVKVGNLCSSFCPFHVREQIYFTAHLSLQLMRSNKNS